MTNDYPVRIELHSPASFERMQLLVRILLAIMFGWVGITVGWVVCVLYGALPLVAAIAISLRGGAYNQEELGGRTWRALAWLLRLCAYMMLLVDRFPAERRDDIEIELHPSGLPTVGAALLRLLTSLPSAFVLGVLWFVGGFVWVIAAIFLLATERVPPALLAYQRGVLRWNARLVAYHASLVDEYPPFELDTHDAGTTHEPAAHVL